MGGRCPSRCTDTTLTALDGSRNDASVRVVDVHAASTPAVITTLHVASTGIDAARIVSFGSASMRSGA
jgi:hypothetical protein